MLTNNLIKQGYFEQLGLEVKARISLQVQTLLFTKKSAADLSTDLSKAIKSSCRKDPDQHCDCM